MVSKSAGAGPGSSSVMGRLLRGVHQLASAVHRQGGHLVGDGRNDLDSLDPVR